MRVLIMCMRQTFEARVFAACAYIVKVKTRTEWGMPGTGARDYYPVIII